MILMTVPDKVFTRHITEPVALLCDSKSKWYSHLESGNILSSKKTLASEYDGVSLYRRSSYNGVLLVSILSIEEPFSPMPCTDANVCRSVRKQVYSEGSDLK